MKLANKQILGLDYGLYQHCLNVAGIACPAGMEMGLDSNLCFTSGLLHDIGKVVWASEPMCYDFMEHPDLGYAVLKDIDLDIATIAYMHHSYQTNPYPAVCEIKVPDRLVPYCQLISLADKVEANMTRSHASADDALKVMTKLYDFLPEVVSSVSNVVKRKSYNRVI
jgi:putative nucleotidyltransferase with HDIG domain